MLDLVEATPGARYQAMKEFVDVAGVEAAEAIAKVGKITRDEDAQLVELEDIAATLVRALKDVEARVRANAAWSLGEICAVANPWIGPAQLSYKSWREFMWSRTRFLRRLACSPQRPR